MSLRFREGTVVSRGEIWSLGFGERTVVARGKIRTSREEGVLLSFNSCIHRAAAMD
jgi:hypothetical protein